MHVLFISSWFPDRCHPFNGNFVIKHAEAVALFNEVSFISVTNNPLYDKSNLSISPSINLVEKVYKKCTLPVLGVLVNGIRVIASYLKAFDQIRNERGTPNIVHANIMFPVGLIGIILKWAYGIPYVVTEHWTGFMEESALGIPFWKKRMMRFIVSNASKVCPVSNSLNNAIKRIAPKGNWQVVPNVVDMNLYGPRKEHEGFKFVHISSLRDEQKNISGLLEGVSLLFKADNRFSFHIITCGNSEPFLQKAKDLGLSRNVCFHHRFTPLQIAAFLSECDCLVMFSRVETFGVVVIEAFAAGLPVIATHAGVLGELVNADNGYIVPDGDVEALCGAMLDVMHHENRFDSEKIKEFVKCRFSYEAVGRSYDEIYKQIAVNG